MDKTLKNIRFSIKPQKQEGNISQDVYNKGYKALQKSYNAKRNSFCAPFTSLSAKKSSS